MKHIITTALVLASFFAAPHTYSQNLSKEQVAREFQLQGGPGIVISESQTAENMPAQVKDFISKNFSDVGIANCTHNFLSGSVHVKLTDGSRIDFDKDGRVSDISAPQGSSLSTSVISQVLPEKAVTHLEKAGLIDEVNTIKHASQKGFGIILLNNNPPQMIFDVDGTFIITAY